MNLRKLLCGLLALCLLLTMAPAALMEDAKVDEQTVVLGGDEAASDVVDAEAYNAITYDASQAGVFTLPTDKAELNSSTYLLLGDELIIVADEGYFFTKAESKNVRVIAKEDIEVEDEAVIIAANSRTGKARIDLTMGMEGSAYTANFVVNIVVYDETTPSAVVVDCPNSFTVDMAAGAVGVTAVTVPADLVADLKWSTDKSKVAAPLYALTTNGTENAIVLKGKGTATITVAAGTVKKTFKVKVTDNYAPKSIKIYSTNKDNKLDCVNDAIGIYCQISPAPFVDSFVEYTLENTKYVYFDGDATKAVKKATLANGLVDGEGRVVLLPTGATGKVKITAKTYNGKKASLKVETVNPYTITDIDMYGFYKKETYTAELYNDEWTTDTTKPVKNAFLIVPELFYKIGGVKFQLDEDDGLTYDWEMANVKWSSSNKKVATIGLYKNWLGYGQNQDWEYITDYFGNEVFDDLLDYAAIVEMKGTGTTTLTAKSRDGKQSFSITLKVVDGHAVDSIITSGTVTVPKGEVIDLDEYFVVYPPDYYGKLTVAPSHSTSKITVLGGSVIETKETGDVVIKVKAGDKTAKFTLKIK